ncbi:MAG TPA: hypothetical protein VKG02_04155, partial [Blastocatellia bacterium]|nr:hypothetical protein [Blastocatellia bacterium]
MSRIASIAHNLRLIFSRKITDQMGEIERRLNERSDRYERAVDERIDERLVESQSRLDERARSLDLRLDERFENLERQTDKRFEVVERRLDDRLEAHERRTDKYLLQSRLEIVDRTDVILQIFEQRLDQQRREIRAMREALEGRNEAAKNGGRINSASNSAIASPDPPAPNDKQAPAEQILSFRKM